MKRALVLEGGGAKGAFSLGCVKALRDRKIVFDAVSGTSVGALNAVIFSTGKFKEGERLWAFLSYQELFTVRWPKCLSPIKWVSSAISYRLISVLPRQVRHPPLVDLIASAASGWFVTAFSHVLRWFFLALAPMPWLVSFLLTTLLTLPIALYFFHTQGEGIVGILTAAFFFLLSFCVVGFKTDVRQLLGLQYVGILMIGTLGFLAANLAASFGQPYELPRGLGYWLLGGFITLLIFAFALEQSIFDLRRLYTRICRLSRDATFHIPTYVTTAVKQKRAAGKFHLPMHWGQTRPTEADAFVHRYEAVYHRLDDKAGRSLTRTILASASLPLGLFPPVLLNGELHVDGGTPGEAANTPILPVWDHDEIWVVRLRSEPYQLPKPCKARLVVIKPPFNRSFIWGTFYFDTEQVRMDIAAGEEMAHMVIDAYLSPADT